MDKNYNHQEQEEKIYQSWLDSGAMQAPDAKEAREKGMDPFTIIMPPPNANDPLHVGHAMFVTIEDILIRYHRMKGDATLWLPGTDHAGIETQFVFEKKLAKEGKSRFDFDRETLYQMISEYVDENSGVSVEQMKRLGASADWSRFKFTLDEDVVDRVLDTFKKLHDDGLIYRGLKLVNYCTKCGTSYSELEVDYEEREDKLYFIKYGPFVLATTRPETKFADTAVAVNPKDSRYKDYVGREIEVEGLLGTFKLRVIADEYVDPEFGTGVVKITPYHDFNDYEVWQRHKDEIPEPKQVIGLDGKLTEVAGKYAGMRIKAARELIEKDLEQKGLLAKPTEKYVHNIGVCYRCKNVIEPLPLPQFFLKVNEPKNSLVSKVIGALDKGKVKIHGAGREKVLRNWLMNLKDWNISRQIVWGIRIPVWYKGNNKDDYVVSKTSPGEGWVQEGDTFDTWFSSGQWPVVTLQTTKTGDFDFYYPTSVMETGYDILPFWVMRMLLLGIYMTGKAPFKDVYLHGLIRDEKGQKMSKSKGNGINPLDMVTKYGADALRMALVISSTPGQDKAVGENAIRGMRNLANKIWNAARFVKGLPETHEGEKDLEILGEINDVARKIAKYLETLRVGFAAELAYNKFWHEYCDQYIEAAKGGKISKRAMENSLKTWLMLLHPFVPYVTEACWKELGEEGLLIAQPWPTSVS